VPPQTYVRTNLLGHLNILELVRSLPHCRHLVYASSSSVYGASQDLPYREDDRADAPLSLYAATKRGDELISHAYRGQLTVPQTGLRFFTVYGPWGRPDMAYFSFARKIRAKQPITLFDGGRLKRDFTYIDDIVAGILGCLDRPPTDAPDGSSPAQVLNIGNHDAQPVLELVAALEQALGVPAVIIDLPAPVTEVSETFADISALMALTGVSPGTKLVDGIERFVAWLRRWEDAERIAPRWL
jgi:UDP-glucuronate 4-epimerase